MPAATTSNFANLVAPGLRKVWSDEWKKAKPEYATLLNTETSKRKYEEHIKVGELSSAVEKPEGQPTAFITPTISALKRFTQVSYGVGFRVTREMYDFDLYGPMKRMSRQLAESARDRMEIVGATIFNDAFVTTGNIAPNTSAGFVSTEALCATSHALQGGGTWSNRPSVDVDFSLTALQAACDSLEGVVNEVNMPRPIKPVLVVGDYRYKWAFREVLGSPNKPYTAGNEINPLVDEDLKWFLSHRFTDADQWFVLGSKPNLGLWYFTSKAPTFDPGDDYDTGDAKFKTYFRCVVGYDEARGVYGSSGG